MKVHEQNPRLSGNGIRATVNGEKPAEATSCPVTHDVRTMVELESREQAASPGGQERKPRNESEAVWGPLFKNRENFVEVHLC